MVSVIPHALPSVPNVYTYIHTYVRIYVHVYIGALEAWVLVVAV